MATWVGGAGAFLANPGTLTVTLPAFQANDLAVLVVGNDDSTDPAYATPSGWTFRAKTAAGNLYSYVFTRVLQAGDVSVVITVPASRTGTAAVGIWRDALWNSIGTFGVRGASATTVAAPDHPTAAGARAHIFSDRSVAAAAGEVDTLPTALTYGTSRYFYPGDTTLNASTGICAVYFVDSASGSGANTATLKDSSGNAWGLQVDIQGASGVSHTRSVTDDIGLTDSLRITRNIYQSGDNVGLTALPPVPVKSSAVNTRLINDDIGFTESLMITRNIYQSGDSVGLTELLRVDRNRYQSGDNVGLVARPPVTAMNVVSTSRTITDNVGITESLLVNRNKYQSGDTIGLTDSGRTLATVETITGNPISITGNPTTSKTSGGAATGRPKAYLAGSWQEKPGKVYVAGTGWVEKPWKWWDGTGWKLI
jgi:hypothetical protein